MSKKWQLTIYCGMSNTSTNNSVISHYYNGDWAYDPQMKAHAFAVLWMLRTESLATFPPGIQIKSGAQLVACFFITHQWSTSNRLVTHYKFLCRAAHSFFRKRKGNKSISPLFVDIPQVLTSGENHSDWQTILMPTDGSLENWQAEHSGYRLCTPT